MAQGGLGLTSLKWSPRWEMVRYVNDVQCDSIVIHDVYYRIRTAGVPPGVGIHMEESAKYHPCPIYSLLFPIISKLDPTPSKDGCRKR